MIHLRKILGCRKIVWRYPFSTSSGKDFFEGIKQSSFYRPIVKVQDFLTRLNIEFKPGSSVFRVKECAFCQKPHYNDMSNLFTLNINKETGVYFCHRCRSKGSWSQLQAKYLNIQKNQVKTFLSNSLGDDLSKQSQDFPLSQTEYFFYMNNLKSQGFADVREYLKSRGFTDETLQKYMVGAGVETFISQLGKAVQVKVVYFPMFQLDLKSKPKSQNPNQTSNQQNKTPIKVDVKLMKMKMRGASSQTKKYSRQYPPGPFSGFFGLNTICENDKVVVITQGEFDAMAVNQQTGYPAISLPQGANSLPDSLLPYLNQFQKIILWMDNDQAGKLGQEKMSYKLGNSRTYILKHDYQDLKDANDFLKNAPEKMKSLIQQSKTTAGQNILTFQDLKQSVKNRIFKYEQFVGVQVGWLPFFNKKVKGVRMQELSIVSGPTGCGKTTFLSQMSLDLCKKEIPVLWGSFEIRNQVLITNMLIQYSGVNLFKNKNLFDHYAQQFKNLPLYWLSFHGSNDVQKVLSTIEYAIQKHNVSLVVLDTLQFLLADQAEGIKKFDLQDKVMGRLRRMATDHKVHIVIVIHPRKTQQGQDIQIHSIYGSSKAGQQADNIWMIQKRENFRIFDIKKNRFDGDVGKAAIGYDKTTKSFIQLTRPQLSSLYNNEATIDQIMLKRQETAAQPQNNTEEKTFSMQVQNEANFIYEDMIDSSNKKKKKFTNNYSKNNGS